MENSNGFIIEHDQSFWVLAIIQACTLGLPGIIVGGTLASKYGPGSAVISVIIGNLILWVIGLGIVSMSIQERKNAIQNVESYLGKIGSFVSAFILMLAFLNWYVLQITTSTNTIDKLFSWSSFWKEQLLTIRLGVVFGLTTALFSMGGIRFIKKSCQIVFPFLFLFSLYSIFTSKNDVNYQNTWSFSLAGITSIVAVTLPGTINLPTFFRHGRSKEDCIFALTLLMFFDIFFQLYPILMGYSDPFDFFKVEGHPNAIFYFSFAFAFMTLSLLFTNMVNVYFASAGWELLFHRTWHLKEYAIVGLLGTAAYSFLQVVSPLNFIEDLANDAISSLGVVLLISFLIKAFVKHRPRNFEKLIAASCWIIGILTALVFQVHESLDPSLSLISGMIASLMAFVIVIFIEESIWSIKKIYSKRVN